MIDKFIKNNNNIKYFATGDLTQLKSFGYPLNNIDDMTSYTNNCINIIFNNQIELKINKRLTDTKEQERLDNFKNDLFNNNYKNIVQLFKKYNFNMIHKLEDIKTTNNISYFNYKVKRINEHVHNKVVKIPKNHIEYEHIIKNNKGKFIKKKCKIKYYMNV